MAIKTHQELATEYVAEQFGEGCFSELVAMGTFEENPLATEGPVSVFAFTGRRAGALPEQCVVVAGQTEPNYYPAYTLSAEEVFNLHLGTRFMLVLEIAQLPADAPVGDLQAMASAALVGVVPGQPVQDVRLAAAFQMEQETHIVARARIGPEQVYLVMGELPLGISRQIELPPHIIYRMHVGQLLRLEKTDEAD